jgi:hypothetical protein
MPVLPTKSLLTAISVALLFSSSAEAAKKHHGRAHVATSHAARSAHAAAYRTAASPPMVVFGARVIGTDPDPRIRHELLRDLGAVFGGAD